MKITAELRNWHYNEGWNVFTGDIYDDTKGRWEDGTHIHTSTVVERIDDGERELIVTRNSVYVIYPDKASREDHTEEFVSPATPVAIDH